MPDQTRLKKDGAQGREGDEKRKGLVLPGNRIGVDAAVAHVAGAGIGFSCYLLTKNNAVGNLRYSVSID
ncbi:MAG: hypothetical protein NPIRA03_27940 [Nitrospirales bacterium]|nr:MAG: hypothetical protein NPIRA03_27940 [Nitrospirales bacterium]